MSYSREEQLKVVVYLGGGAYRRTGVARVYLLLDGYGGSNSRNEIHVGLVDTPQELPSIGR